MKKYKYYIPLLLTVMLALSACSSGVKTDDFDKYYNIAKSSQKLEEKDDVIADNKDSSTETLSNIEEGDSSSSEEIDGNKSFEEERESSTSYKEGACDIHFLDVGQGDCTLVLCDDEAMLIDSAVSDKGTWIQNYLQKQGVDKLKYFIATHPDADHIGSAQVIITKFPIETMMMPNIQSDTKTFERMVSAIKHKRIEPINPSVGNEYTLGSAVFTILNPGDRAYAEGDINNYSIAIKLQFGNDTALLIGDCEKEAEKKMLESDIDIDVDLLKAGHHGSSTSADEEFLSSVSPRYTVISCGVNNDYGHPHARTLNTIRSFGSELYRTDEQGSIIATLTGDGIVFNTSPAENWQVGNKEVSEYISEEDYKDHYLNTFDDLGCIFSGSEDAVEDYYVLNLNSHKYHRPSCQSVLDMAEHNKLISYSTKDLIENDGFIPCGACKP